jgi:hypothetical protein
LNEGRGVEQNTPSWRITTVQATHWTGGPRSIGLDRLRSELVQGSLDDALAKADGEQRFLVDFFSLAEVAAYCWVSNISSQKFQDYFGTNFVMLRANRTQKVGEEIFKKFNIMGTPTVMILASDGSEVDWHVGYGPPPEKFHERVDKSYRGIETFRFYADQYAKDPKNLDVVFRLAKKHGDRYDQDKATALYNEVLAIDPDGKKGTTDYDKTKVSYTQYAEFQCVVALRAKGGPRVQIIYHEISGRELVSSMRPCYSRSTANDTVTKF